METWMLLWHNRVNTGAEHRDLFVVSCFLPESFMEILGMSRHIFSQVAEAIQVNISVAQGLGAVLLRVVRDPSGPPVLS